MDDQKIQLNVREAQVDPGTIVGGRYRILSLIGKGGMGKVFTAKHELLDKTVAIKILPPELVDDELAKQRFYREAKLASSLEHANISVVHDYGVMDDGAPFLVMDYASGKPLSQILKTESPLAKERFVDIFRQACAALHHAHMKGIVHRDVKPSNIMVDEAGGVRMVKLVDFGIAHGSGYHQAVTSTGQITGTPYYISPEQCVGGQVDQRADIYSLGCVMFEALCGRPPFVSDNVMATIYQHINDPPPTLVSMDSRFANEHLLEKIIARVLAKDPAARFQSADELGAALSSLLHVSWSTPVMTPPNVVTEGKTPKKSLLQRRLFIGVGALVGVFGLLCFLGSLDNGGSGTKPATEQTQKTLVQNTSQERPVIAPATLKHASEISNWPRFSYNGVSFAYRKSWKTQEHPDKDTVVKFTDVQLGPLAGGEIAFAVAEASGINVEGYSKVIDAALTSTLKDYRVIRSKNESWGGFKGIRTNAAFKYDGTDCGVQWYCFQHDDEVMALSVTSWNANEAQTAAEFNKVLASLAADE